MNASFLLFVSVFCCLMSSLSVNAPPPPDKMGSKRRSSDIISLLVSIYGSKDIFIDEYRAVLADRLLHQLNYNTARWDLHMMSDCITPEFSLQVLHQLSALKLVLCGTFAGRFVTWSC